ncbi:hypothetical protein [Pseudarthrobacter sp. GA104]|uniref:hypothetical protein n=1 Tax=Pseudarthrobacter sp. GA104 TaxID=2676311 RepID=UPI0012FCD998|nr:hypothetical protein [Pseudarthrobacter sp. GA104]MUU71500.1 hypothetical protein [Pseudarthrobacter sp. GA104]
MADYTKTFTAAAMHAEPAWLDPKGGVERTISFAAEAASKGAEAGSSDARARLVSGDEPRCRTGDP